MGRQQARGPWLAVIALAMVACGPMRMTTVTAASPAAVQAPSQAPQGLAPVPAPAPPAQERALTVITTTPCGTPLPAPAALPPAGAPPFVWQLEVCFPRQGNSPSIEVETYMYYIKLRGSQPSQGNFVNY